MTRLILVLAATLSCACVHIARDASDTRLAQLRSRSTPRQSHPNSLEAFASVDALRREMSAVLEARRANLERSLQALPAYADCEASAASDVDVTIVCSSPTISVSTVRATSITNNQHRGVDEGDIVKREGDVLIVLRRGRLFTIGIDGGRLDSLTVTNAFGPTTDGIDPADTWYDELLVWRHTVVVIGYSYARGGTEIGLFDLGDRGDLRYRATYHLRSDDYYSRRNYASRLIDDRLVLFTSATVWEDVEPASWLPALRRWNPRGPKGAFETIAPIDRVFQPLGELGSYPSVHSLISCSLAAPAMTCESTVVLGDDLTAYYASPTAAYAWTTGWRRDGPSRSILYRMPFDGSPVSAIGVAGRPPDQLAFFEDSDRVLNVVAHQEDASVTLLRVPPNAFSDGSFDLPRQFYRTLAHASSVVARFVGEYVVVGVSVYGDEDNTGRFVITRWRSSSTTPFSVPHAVERIEAMGRHAVVIGDDRGHLAMTAVRLDSRPALGGTFVEPDASEAEQRSHAFFYREDGGEEGVFGLPVSAPGVRKDDLRRMRPARILFLQNRGLTLLAAGSLEPPAKEMVDDRCLASCVDWYGDARPIFAGDRILALSGYTMTEGQFAGGFVTSLDSLDFTP